MMGQRLSCGLRKRKQGRIFLNNPSHTRTLSCAAQLQPCRNTHVLQAFLDAD